MVLAVPTETIRVWIDAAPKGPYIAGRLMDKGFR
jgi:hypothetical protein